MKMIYGMSESHLYTGKELSMSERLNYMSLISLDGQFNIVAMGGIRWCQFNSTSATMDG